MNDPEWEICEDCGNPKWATAHSIQLDTAAMREEFIGFHEFKPSGRYMEAQT